MFDDKTLAEREGDGAILMLFREWQRRVFAINDGSDRSEETRERINEIEETIAATPAAGIAGFAVKVAIQIDYEVGSCVVNDDMTAMFWRSILNDAARLVPDLAGFEEWLRAQKP